MTELPSLDPRANAFRSDLADARIAGSVTAARYVEPAMRQCVRGVVPLLAAPVPDAHQASQIRYGEFVDVFEDRDGFAWVQNRADHCVGYMPSEGALIDAIADLSTRVSVLRTFLYPAPDAKSPPVDELTLGSCVRPVGNAKNGFLRLASGGYVFDKHVAPVEVTTERDYVFTAGRMLNAPYFSGGRTPKGLDSPGLVQLGLEMAGIECPRASDQQREAFGQPLPVHWRDMPWKRGDIVFFEGLCGIMTGGEQFIHASAYEMKVTVEPLFDVVMRGHDILAFGRPSF